MAQDWQRFVPNVFGGYIVYIDHVESANPEVYFEHIRLRARQFLNQDLWGALYIEGVTHPTQIRLDTYHYNRTYVVIYGKMMRLISSVVKF